MTTRTKNAKAMRPLFLIALQYTHILCRVAESRSRDRVPKFTGISGVAALRPNRRRSGGMAAGQRDAYHLRVARLSSQSPRPTLPRCGLLTSAGVQINEMRVFRQSELSETIDSVRSQIPEGFTVFVPGQMVKLDMKGEIRAQSSRAENGPARGVVDPQA